MQRFYMTTHDNNNLILFNTFIQLPQKTSTTRRSCNLSTFLLFKYKVANEIKIQRRAILFWMLQAYRYKRYSYIRVCLRDLVFINKSIIWSHNKKLLVSLIRFILWVSYGTIYIPVWYMWVTVTFMMKIIEHNLNV